MNSTAKTIKKTGAGGGKQGFIIYCCAESRFPQKYGLFRLISVYCSPKLKLIMATPNLNKNTKLTTAKNAGVLFTKENQKWMIIGGVLIVLGFILMSGGKSDPNEFDPSKVYSPLRITIAPILILAGLGLEVFAIMKKPKSDA